MNSKSTPTEPPAIECKSASAGRAASTLFCVGLPDSQGGMCWLAGYESDPTRYYTPMTALRFKTRSAASAAIVRAKRTHPGKERSYQILRVSEMDVPDQATAKGKL